MLDVVERGRRTRRAGGGIVADSEQEAEYSETMAKAEKFINLRAR